MRKLSIYLFIALLITLPLGVLYAGSVDHNSNFSAGYVRTLSRGAAFDSADAAVYNPAGTVKLDDGLHLSLSNQFILKEYSHENGDTYTADNPILLLPGAFLVFKHDGWAAFGSFNIPGGGGDVQYDDGIIDVAAMDPFGPSAIARQVYYGFTAGGAYAITDAIAVSLGGRFIFASKNATVETDTTIPAGALGPLGPPTSTKDVIDFTASANGIAGIIGLHLTPMEGLNIGVHFETVTKMEWEYDEVSGFGGPLFGIVEGEKYDRDLPCLLAAGVSYQILPQLRADASFNLYFNKSADWDGAEDDYNNGIELALAVEYALLEQLRLSGGFLYSFNAVDEDSYSGFDYLAPELNSISFAAGAAFEIIPKLVLEGGVVRNIYFEGDGKSATGLDVTLNKGAWLIAIGASYKFF